MCLLSGAFRLGFIANFLSQPILTGYLCGISLTLLTSQIGRLTTVHLEDKGLLRPLIELGGHLTQIDLSTLVLGIGILFLLRLLKWWAPRSPGPLVAVIIATSLSFAFDLESFGISVLGKIPTVSPSLTLRMPEGIELYDLAQNAFGILVVSFGSGIVTARSFGAKNRYRVVSRQHRARNVFRASRGRGLTFEKSSADEALHHFPCPRCYEIEG